MESSWQVKCGSTLRSPMPPVASSTSQQLRNQMDFNSSHQHRPHVGHDIGEQRSAKLPDSMFPNVPNLSSFNSNHGNLGNSYMALLSAPASFSQSNFQDFSCPKPISASCYLVADANSTAVRATGSLVPTMPGGLLSENGGYQNLGNNPDLYPLASTRALSSSSAGRISKHYGLQVSDFHRHGTDLAKAAVIHRSLPANEKARDFPFLTEECRGTNSANALKLQYRETQMPKKITLGADSHVLNTSTFTAWCPRVVCAGTSGDLLLSNTGLLGILCSCHGFHMSVSKFCEHSGLRNVNPGDSVRVDDEGTIAQWRKQYFQKFGIRVPEDQIGWDWPEGLSLTASLAKPNISASMSRNSDCNNMAAASGSLVRFRQPVKEAILLKNRTADQSSNIRALHNQKHRKNQDHDKILDMVCSLSSNSLAVAYDSTPNGPLPNRSTKPMFAGRGHGDDCQSTYSYVDDTLRAKNFPITSLAGDNLRSGHKSSGVGKHKNGKDVITVDKDAASSIELRLGQPNQLTQSSKTPILLPDGPWLYNTVATSLKPLPQEQMHCVSSRCRGKEPRQYLPFTAGISNSSRSQDQLSYRNCAISNASKQEVGGKMAIPSVASPLNYFSSPPEGLSCPKVCSNISNFKERIFPGIKVQCQSPSIKSNPTNATWDSGYNLEKEWTVSELGLSGSIEKGNVVRCLSGGNSLDETGSGSEMHNTLTEDPYSFTGVAGVNNNSVYPTMHDRDLFSHHLSNIPMDAPDAGNNSSYLEKVPFFGRSSYLETDHVHFSSFGSPMGSGKLLSSKSVPIGSHSSASTSIPVLNTSLLNQENGGLNHYFADDNLRLLALRQILELSQPPLLSSIEKNIEQELHNDFSGTQMQHSLIELSASGEKRHGPKLASEQHLSEVVMKQFQPGSAGSNIWCNSTTCTQVIPLCSKDIDMQSQLSRDSLRNATPSLRFANKTSISCSNDGERCCQIMQYLKGKCSCPACKQSSGSQCELGGENASRSFREPVGVAGCKPLLFTSQFVKDCISPSETSTSHDQCKNLKGQLNFSCCGSQWRDVPKKAEGACEAAFKKQSGKLMVGRGHELSTTAENSAAQGSSGAVKIEDFFKEQDISNVSSGCSTPDVNARISTELNNPDSSTVIAGNSECEKNLVVDEGSGIDKCWSSDDASGSDRSAGFYGSTSDTSLRKDDQFKVTNSQSSRSLLEEVKLINSLTWKRGRSQISSEIIAHEKSFHSEGLYRDRKAWKRKREMKSNMIETSLDSAGPAACNEYPKCDRTTEKPGLSKDVESVLSSKGTAAISTVHSTKPNSRQTKSTLPLDKPVSRKRDLHRIYNAKDKGKNVSDYAIPDDSIRKKARSGTSGCWKLFRADQPTCAVYGKTVDYGSASCKKESQSQQVNGCCRKKKPVVCGKYGEISSGEKAGNLPKLAKIVSLERVLKRTEKCAIPKTFKPVPILQKEMNRKKSCSNDPFSEKFSNLKENKNNGGLKERDNYIHGEKQSTGESLILEKGKDEGIGKDAGSIDTNARTNPKPKCKETRRRSLYELTLKGSNYSSELHSQKKIIKCSPKIEDEKVRSNSEDSQCYIPGSENINVEKYTREQKHQPTINPEALCCVCGSSKEDEINCFVECGRCLIKVHQACYGIYRVPKSTWYCRPCQTSSKDIVCVLCGYGGGAMTRALRSHAIVKSLLKAWSFKMECRPKVMLYSAESLRDKLNVLNSSGSVCKHNSYPVSRPVDIEQSSATACNKNMRNELDFVQNSLGSASTPKVHNSITAGVLDPTTKQWVHMVCGLWTPGTRCPNVNTMSAFDVSGASSPRTCMVCSICNRPGGTCIQCRVASCSVQFHPWCAHQKGLLQSEVEGLNKENVGFYGRCLIHAMGSTSKNETSPPVTKAESCARTEGYKGRKRDGFWHNLHGQSQGNGGCLVPQEQLNAWVHINGQKSFVQGLPKLPLSDMEYDCRKEYARYKQSKGWKHLVVYKSDIHALGLYTSRFISRGEMVVEYVGEIVGLRVADKRENQYQSGRKLQYKSACYFFRIDKEHIIDATRKGGIARFVNHSCLPNCVAKVISVRNEKKVVFFAERDICPGEEITYDYHFNNEDEGKKIPCFCNSKNCRRHLN